MGQQLRIDGPKYATAFNFYVTLAHPTDADSVVSNPAQAAGDWTISKDGGAFANLATLPAVTPSSSVSLKIALSAGEMTADHVLIVGKDQTATEEWQACSIGIVTRVVTVDELARSTTPANTLDIDSDGRVDVSMLAGSAAKVTALAAAIDSSNNVVYADATRISGDSTAADNLEAAHDGTGYVGGTLKPTVNVTQWAGTATAIDGTSGFPKVDVAAIASSTADAVSLGTAIDTSNNVVASNVTYISGDNAAADNLEAAFDGTGYAGGTILQSVNIGQISGDATAADNLELYCDGTTPIPANVTQISDDATAASNLEAMVDGTGLTLAGCVMPTTTTVTDAVTISGTQAHAENTNALTTSALLVAAAAAVTNRVTSDGSTHVTYKSDAITPLATRTQTSTSLTP